MANDPIRGRTIRWRYVDGPTKGTEFEHVFATDGTVTYRMLGQQSKSENGSAKAERPTYEVEKITDDVWAVSYLAPSGFTLTTVLDQRSAKIVSFASNEKELVVQHGTFEAIAAAAR